MINEAFEVNQSTLEDSGKRAWWVRGRGDKKRMSERGLKNQSESLFKKGIPTMLKSADS